MESEKCVGTVILHAAYLTLNTLVHLFSSQSVHCEMMPMFDTVGTNNCVIALKGVIEAYVQDCIYSTIVP
jgi:hypothetical protein